jgi:O-antigen/teichoic acid export membrane protein
VSVRATKLPAGSGRLSTLAEHVQVPLYRNGYALVLNSVLTAILGVAYWLVAARDYTPHVVGVNTAVISAMMFLAGVAQLNLISALLRFVPVLGGLRGRFISVCYAAVACAAVLCAAVFLLGIHLWAPTLEALRSSSGMIASFVGATVAWCVFALQDSALTALGAAVLVPLENAVYGIAKIALLVLLASASPHWGIFASWSAALAVSLVPVNALIAGRLLRPQSRADAQPKAAPSRPEILKFVAPDYLAALLWLAATTLMPLIVVGVAGATANAFYSLAWMINLPLILVSVNTGQALVVAGAADPARVAEYARKVLRQTARLVVPAAVLMAVAAPYVLRLFGREYATRGALTLSLLALSSIPNMITVLHVSVYRVQRRMRAVVALLAAQCGSLLLLGTALLAASGIVGVGAAWLVCQTTVAVILLRLDSTVFGPGDGRLLDLAARLGLVTVLRALRAHNRRRRNGRALTRCLPHGLVLTNTCRTVNDVAVGRARMVGGTSEVIIKLALSPSAAAGLQRETRVLNLLKNDPRLESWGVARPEIRALGQLGQRCYIVESCLRGVTAGQRLAEGADRGRVVTAALSAIEGLHAHTERIVTVDEALLGCWVDGPARAVEGAVAGSVARTEALQRVTSELRGWLERRTIPAGWVHGDFVPENVLIDPREDSRVTGVIDWESATTPDLPVIDAAMFVLAAHCQLEGRELGDVVGAVVRGTAGSFLLDALAEAARALDEPPDPRKVALLCWLRHLAFAIQKGNRYARNRVWKRSNIDRVLDTLVHESRVIGARE